MFFFVFRLPPPFALQATNALVDERTLKQLAHPVTGLRPPPIHGYTTAETALFKE